MRLLFTLVQKGFYFVPALPMFAMGFALVSAPGVYAFAQWLPKAAVKKLTWLSGALLAVAVALVVSNVGRASRDVDLLHDVNVIGALMPHGAEIGVNERGWTNWNFNCYMMRYYNITVSPNHPSRYFLMDTYQPDPPPNGYRESSFQTRRYKIFER